MNELKNGDSTAPGDGGESNGDTPGQDLLDMTPGGEWHAPRGWKTRVVVWLILTLFAATLVAGLILIAVLVFG